jgi:hypothetical protein
LDAEPAIGVDKHWQAENRGVDDAGYESAGLRALLANADSVSVGRDARVADVDVVAPRC